MEKTCETIERTLGRSGAFRKVEERLYVVRQGSAYVTISVIPAKRKGRHPLVRIYAQVVAGVRPDPSLFHRLLTLNVHLRFGAFAYEPRGHLILFVHSILGGVHLDPQELTAVVSEIALLADQYDDRIVAEYGGMRMQDIVEEAAMAHFLGFHSRQDDDGPWD